MRIKLLAMLLMVLLSAEYVNAATNHYYTDSYTVTVGRSITLQYNHYFNSFSCQPWGYGTEQIAVSYWNNGVATIKAVQKTSGVPTVTMCYSDYDGWGSLRHQYSHYCNIVVVELLGVSIPQELNLKVGETSALSPKLSPSDASTSYTWHSSNTAVAEVSDKGVVSAKGVGDAKITCTTHNGKTSVCTVFVSPILATDLAISPTELRMKKGDRYQLETTIKPDNASQKKLKWESSNPSAVQISSQGNIVACGYGTSIITARTTDGSNLSCDCIVEVEEVKAESLILSHKDIIGSVGDKYALSATIYPEDATNKTVYWFSSDSNVASVGKDGMVELLKSGTSVITALLANNEALSAQCKVTVTDDAGMTEVVDGEKLRVAVAGGRLTVAGLNDGEDVSVYNAMGALVGKGAESGATAEVELHCGGVLVVVTSNGRSAKIICNDL